jgi:Fe-S-cluster-containing dehydrogenase component
MKQVYFIPNRCMGCEECVIACAKAHGWESRAYVEVVAGYFPFPMRCNHCADAPCQAVCPAQAISRTAQGMVVVDTDKCIGCGTCVIACPFGVPRISETTHKVIKCDGCQDKVAQGEVPVCVAACPKGAIQFGDYAEPLQNRRLRLASQVKTAVALGAGW